MGPRAPMAGIGRIYRATDRTMASDHQGTSGAWISAARMQVLGSCRARVLGKVPAKLLLSYKAPPAVVTSCHHYACTGAMVSLSMAGVGGGSGNDTYTMLCLRLRKLLAVQADLAHGADGPRVPGGLGSKDMVILQRVMRCRRCRAI